MRRLVCSLLLLTLAGCATTSPRKVSITPSAMQEISDQFEYAQAVRVGRTIWVSGQVGYGAGGIPDGVTAQTRLAFENMRLVLAQAGATLDDIVELTSYHVAMEDLGAFMEVKSAFLAKPFPAWTAVEVSALAEPGLLVEIKAVAEVGSGR